MKANALWIEILLTFIVALAVTAIVTLLWSWLRHGVTAVDWEISFTMAVILAIIVPLSAHFRTQK